MSINQALISGNLGQNPEIKEVNGQKVASFSVATTRRWKDKDGNTQEKTEWHSIVFWGKVVELVIEKYVKKGDKVTVIGRLETQSYEDKDGIKRYQTRIIGETLDLCGSSKSENSQQSTQVPVENYVSDNNGVDDLPF
jgi:single-strand DNA-binding protein